MQSGFSDFHQFPSLPASLGEGGGRFGLYIRYNTFLLVRSTIYLFSLLVSGRLGLANPASTVLILGGHAYRFRVCSIPCFLRRLRQLVW